jgi:5'-3' exonuclease
MYDGKRVLIIDQLNLFFRNYIVNPALSTNGAPIGGLRGCMQSIQKICRESKPDYIVICWDGEGGSAKRKSMQKDYKKGRKPIRLNRGVRNMTPEEEMENKIWQQTRLIDYYNHIPVVQLMYKSTEADDIIAYVSGLKELQNAEKLIVSSDKDFHQLLTGKTVQYRPIQKEILNERNIVDKYDVHPTNFAMARAMVGDKSDNIVGIPGMGLKTVAKRFPFLKDSKTASFDDIVDHCRLMLENSKVKAYERVLEEQALIRKNYAMMQLYAPMLTVNAKKEIREIFSDPDLSFNKTELLKMMIKDGFGEINFIDLFQHLNKISIDNR